MDTKNFQFLHQFRVEADPGHFSFFVGCHDDRYTSSWINCQQNNLTTILPTGRSVDRLTSQHINKGRKHGMKKIIDGKRYDTEKAEEIAAWGNG